MGSPNGVPVPCTATAATCHASTSALASVDRITACRHMVMVCQLCTQKVTRQCAAHQHDHEQVGCQVKISMHLLSRSTGCCQAAGAPILVDRRAAQERCGTVATAVVRHVVNSTCQ